MKELLWVAGGLQLVVAAANLPAKRILALEADLAKLAPMTRQIYHVQHAYIVGILVFFGGLTLTRPPDGLLAGFLSLFWGARLVVQRFYYDRDVLRRHRAADVFFTLTFAYLTAVFAAAAAGALR